MSAVLFRKSQQKKLWSTIRGAFSGGAPGWLYDDSNMSTLYQDAAGTTSVTALEQPVGKQLDLSGRGNHRTQSSSPNRPVWSARYNLLTKTEALNDAAWAKFGFTLASSTETAPDGTATAAKLTENNTDSNPRVYQSITASSESRAYIAYLKASAPTTINFSTTGGISNTITLTTSWQAFTVTQAVSNGVGGLIGGFSSVTRGSGISIYIWHPDLRHSDQATGLIPTYQRVDTATSYDSVGFPAGLRWNGSNSWMQNASVDFSGTNKVSLVVGVRKLSDATTGTIVSNFPGSISTPSFSLYAPYNNAEASFGYTSYGSGFGSAGTALPYASPKTAVLATKYVSTAVGAVNQILPRVDGVDKTLTVNANNASGWSGYGNNPAYFGATRGTSLFFNGLTFSNIAIGIELSASQIAAFEQFTRQKSAAY